MEWKGYDKNNNIIYELKDGKGYVKEYNYGNLYFEAEYSNGEKNGKGKEYDFNGKLEFEGEYLNNKKNGKGREYFSNGKLKFKGEYLNNCRWNGIGYDKFNEILYIIKNGKKS